MAFKFSSQAGHAAGTGPVTDASAGQKQFHRGAPSCTARRPFEEAWGKERLHCFAQPVLTSMIWNASSMAGILCKCCPALPFFNFASHLLASFPWQSFAGLFA